MIEENELDDEKQYEIIDGDIDGVKCRAIQAKPSGNVLFTLNINFTDEQADEVFNLANIFFNDGMRFGISQTQAQAQQVFGLTPKLIKEWYEAAVAQEQIVKNQTDKAA